MLASSISYPPRAWRVVLGLCLAAPLLAQAAVYRCGNRYSDSPCAGPGQTAETVRAPNGMGAPSAYERATAKQYDRETTAETAAGRARQERADAAFRRDHAAEAARAAGVRAGMFERRVVAGMTREQVDSLYGHPAETSGDGAAETWRWRDGRSRRSVTFANGVVVKASEETTGTGRRGRRR